MIMVTIFMLYPFIWNIISSFKSSAEFLGNPFSLPETLEWSNYARALEKSKIIANFKNTVYIEILTCFFFVLLVVPTSYTLARFKFFSSRLQNSFYMSLIFIQAQCIMIPLFLQMNQLNWLNKLTPLALLYAVMSCPFAIFLLSGYMKGIPKDFEEAAKIDGCGNFRILRSVIIPMVKPGIATVVMLTAMNTWNEYPVALVMLTDENKLTISVGVAAMYEVQRYSTDWGALFAALVLVLLPTVAIYIFGQKYLIAGANLGGVKE
ncbi:carbohydrate ABC transporter permease [Oscillospiraceae bacterium HV4-5-C5C]|nr:carbohydrate ABC transporter permease [Oscillospiraceae bacterium HV4-5-C5C]